MDLRQAAVAVKQAGRLVRQRPLRVVQGGTLQRAELRDVGHRQLCEDLEEPAGRASGPGERGFGGALVRDTPRKHGAERGAQAGNAGLEALLWTPPLPHTTSAISQVDLTFARCSIIGTITPQ